MLDSIDDPVSCVACMYWAPNGFTILDYKDEALCRHHRDVKGAMDHAVSVAAQSIADAEDALYLESLNNMIATTAEEASDD